MVRYRAADDYDGTKPPPREKHAVAPDVETLKRTPHRRPFREGHLAVCAWRSELVCPECAQQHYVCSNLRHGNAQSGARSGDDRIPEAHSSVYLGI
jgi:hypothetical protein